MSIEKVVVFKPLNIPSSKRSIRRSDDKTFSDWAHGISKDNFYIC